MGEKEKKGVIVDKLTAKNKHLITLTIIVMLFGLFFITYVALVNAEERCFNKFQDAMITIENDPCMGACLNPISASWLEQQNITLYQEEYYDTEKP